MSEAAIRTTELTRSFDALVALEPLSVEIEPGRVTGLIGPNGSGKSTFLRMLFGLTPPTAGGVEVDGVRMQGDGTNVRKHATFGPGELGYYPELSAAKHLRWCLRGRGLRARRRGRELMERLGLPVDSKVRGFSHGMKRQLLFAAAMAPDVPVRILDEPTEGLDPSKRGQILEIIEEDVAGGTTVLLSSHHLGEIDRVCERLLFLDRGRLVGDEQSVELARRARRLVRLEWEDEEKAAGARPAIASIAPGVVRWDGTRATLELDSDDPRSFLAALAARAYVPAPMAIEYGRLSLGELYRDLYGVEGV